jgi:hypothetical protein
MIETVTEFLKRAFWKVIHLIHLNYLTFYGINFRPKLKTSSCVQDLNEFTLKGIVYRYSKHRGIVS